MIFLDVRLKNLLSFCRFLLRFGSQTGVGLCFIFQFEIACIAVWTDVMTAKMAVMFRLFVFLSELAVKQLAFCSRSVLQLLLGSYSLHRLHIR